MDGTDESTKAPESEPLATPEFRIVPNLKKILESHRRWVESGFKEGECADLSKAILHGEDLKGDKLQFAHLEGADLSEANLDGATLLGAKLKGAYLFRAHLENANLREAHLENAYLSEAQLENAYLFRAHLENANLSEVHLENANLCGAHLENANLSEAHLERADLSEAHLENANLCGAHLKKPGLWKGLWKAKAVLLDANLSDADLRDVEGARFDSTIVRNARFSPRARDPWSVLRRNYSGPKFLFHLIFLIAFLVSYAAKTMFWVGVNHAQETVVATTTQMSGIAEQLKREGHPSSVLLGEMVEHHTNILPCLKEKCAKLAVWEALIRRNEGAAYWSLALALLAYNVCRGFLTWFVAPLRDEEERSGHTPPFKYRAPENATRIDSILGWVYSRFRVYGWLVGVHWLVQGLFVVAVASLLYHGWDLLVDTHVWVPA